MAAPVVHAALATDQVGTLAVVVIVVIVVIGVILSLVMNKAIGRSCWRSS